MHLRTFSAGTMAEALYQVKSAMGNDAVILHTRTYWRRRWLGLRRVEVVEITAGAGLQTARKDARRPLTRQPAPAPPAPAKSASNAPQQLLQTPAASNAVILGLSQDLGALKNMVLDLVKQSRAQNKSRVHPRKTRRADRAHDARRRPDQSRQRIGPARRRPHRPHRRW